MQCAEPRRATHWSAALAVGLAGSSGCPGDGAGDELASQDPLDGRLVDEVAAWYPPSEAATDSRRALAMATKRIKKPALRRAKNSRATLQARPVALPPASPDVAALVERAHLGKHAQRILQLVRASIRIETRSAGNRPLERGASRFGGIPDLPPSIEWPRLRGFALSFVAQLRMSDVAPFDIERGLPSSGILYFFLLDYLHGEQEPDGPLFGTSFVTHYDGDLAALRPAAFPKSLPKLTRFKPCLLTFTAEPSLPPPESAFLDDVAMSSDERSRYWNDVWLALVGRGRSHRLLGYAEATVKHDLQPANAALLLQLNSDNAAAMFFGDMSKVFFFIPEEALARCSFEKVSSGLDVG